MKQKKTVPKAKIKGKENCYYCKQKIEPDYKDVETLKRNLSERGKIIARKYSGTCQKHQKLLSRAIKRARYLALIPFVTRPS